MTVHTVRLIRPRFNIKTVFPSIFFHFKGKSVYSIIPKMITKYNLGIPIFPTLRVSRSRDRLIFTTVSHIKTLPVKQIHKKYVDKSSLREVGWRVVVFMQRCCLPTILFLGTSVPGKTAFINIGTGSKCHSPDQCGGWT